MEGKTVNAIYDEASQVWRKPQRRRLQCVHKDNGFFDTRYQMNYSVGVSIALRELVLFFLMIATIDSAEQNTFQTVHHKWRQPCSSYLLTCFTVYVCINQLQRNERTSMFWHILMVMTVDCCGLILAAIAPKEQDADFQGQPSNLKERVLDKRSFPNNITIL